MKRCSKAKIPTHTNFGLVHTELLTIEDIDEKIISVANNFFFFFVELILFS